tara:strand:+ start:2700 stop:3002 length:303 start_codon:yes stop_codon:yes gene_type:complete
MNRYQFQRPIVKLDNKRIQGQTIYPAIMPRSTDLYIVVRDGQRMDTIANEYYGDASMWWIIAQANNIGGGTLFLQPGKQIRIPQDLGKINTELEKINKER